MHYLTLQEDNGSITDISLDGAENIEIVQYSQDGLREEVVLPLSHLKQLVDYLSHPSVGAW